MNSSRVRSHILLIVSLSVSGLCRADERAWAEGIVLPPAMTVVAVWVAACVFLRMPGDIYQRSLVAVLSAPAGAVGFFLLCEFIIDFFYEASPLTPFPFIISAAVVMAAPFLLRRRNRPK
jgi:hypothetical protein